MNRIKELRVEKGLKQLDLAKELGISQGTLSYWERGSYEPDQKSLLKLADIFSVSVDYILGRENTKKLPKKERIPLKALCLRYGMVARRK